MRILHISTRLILGGSQENTVLSCEGQARLGHDVHLAFGPIYGPEGSLLDRVHAFRARPGQSPDPPPGSSPDPSPIPPPDASHAPAAPPRGITTHLLPHMVRAIHPWHDACCLRGDLPRLLRDLDPDVVHTHSSKAGVLGRFAAWSALHASAGRARRRPAVVHTIHGPPFAPSPPRNAGRVAALKVAAANALYTRAERAAARRCHLIVSVADAMTAQFLARGIGVAEQFVTVRSGMDLAPFLNPPAHASRQAARRALGLHDRHFVVGTIARLADQKGHDDLLDALAPTLAQRPDWRLLWVGDGWRRTALLARARDLGLRVRTLDEPARHAAATDPDARIIITGLVPPERIPEYLRAMDVLAHPSYREGLPRTVVQALLAQRPVVAYDCDGTGEACREMETGRLVRTGDRAGLRDALVWTADHPDRARELALAGQRWCVERFGAETMVNALEDVYARAIRMAERGGRGPS